jgi:transcription initiation factor TFIIH subunit 2
MHCLTFSHAPKHSTREVVIVFGALISSDAGDIHRTIRSLIEDNVSVRVVGLAAQVAVCQELCRATNAGDDCKISKSPGTDYSDVWGCLE